MTPVVESRTHSRSECAVFCKTNERFGGLSNFAASFPLVVNGVPIRTSEALFQACRFPHLPDVQQMIIDQRSPMAAKMKSKAYRSQSRTDWRRINVQLMRSCLRVKLALHWEKFGGLLLETLDRPIVEVSWKDGFWGAKPVGTLTLAEANMLGRLLMELREQIRTDRESLMQVDPPELPNFFLLGAQIGRIAACVHKAERDAGVNIIAATSRVVMNVGPTPATISDCRLTFA